MEIREELSHQLLDNTRNKCLLDVELYKQSANMYSRMEGAISVLSDMQADKSYIYKSGAALQLGLSLDENPAEIETIWEERC